MNTPHPMTHRQLMENCLGGYDLPRTPVALWRHFPVDDQSADGLISATAAFQRQYDFDLIKVSPSSSYCIKGWGCEDQWMGNTEGTRHYIKYPIHQPDDWHKLIPLSPTMGQPGNLLTCLRQITREFGKDTPVIMTIFSPLSQAKNLIGKENLQGHLRMYPDALHSALKVITQTTIDFIQEAVKTGVDGIFYAVQHAQYGLLSEDEFKTFGIGYDLQVLEAAQGCWLNMAHIHGDNIMYDMVASYPVEILNWHDRQTRPSLRDARKHFKGTLCGGLKQWETMAYGTPEQVFAEAQDAIQSSGRTQFILGTGCVMPIITPHGNILSALKAARP